MSLQHIFQAVLQTSIMAGVIVVLILLVHLIVGNRLGMRWRYLLWMLVIVRLLLPHSIESKASIFNLADSIERKISAELSDLAFLGGRSQLSNLDYTMHEEDKTHSEADMVPTATQPTDKSAMQGMGLINLFALIWLGGAIFFGIYALVVNIRFWLNIRKADSLLNARAYEILDEARKKMKVHTHIPLVESDKVFCSALFGFVRPRLIIPKSVMDTMNDEELYYIMLHELAHYKQNDILIGWLTTILKVIHWFNPLLWYAFYRIRQDREISCDMIALAHMDKESGIRYGKTLIKLVESYKKTVKVSGMAGIIEGNSPLKKRILAIKTHEPLGIMRSITASVLFLMIILITLTNPVQAGNSNSNMQLASWGTSDNSSSVQKIMDSTSLASAREAIFESLSGFYDRSMEAAIRQLLNKPEGELSQSDIESITSLTIIGPYVSENLGYINGFLEHGYIDKDGMVHNEKGSIENLSDIGKLSSLITLEVDWQKSLDPFTLTYPPKLRNLRLRCDGLTDLSFLLGQDQIQSIFLDRNAITDTAPLAELINLRELSLNNNRIRDITPVGRLTNLFWLDISVNPINDIKPLSQLKELRYLYAANISRFDLNAITGLTELKELSLPDCDLKSLDGIETLKNLEILFISNNQISDIQVLQVLPNLEVIDLSNNPIEDYSPLFNIPSLKRVVLHNFHDTTLIQKLEEKGIVVIR